MVKKKITKKKTTSKKPVKKSVVKKISQNIPIIEKRKKKAGKLFIYSLIAFILSLIFYYSSSDITIQGIFGFTAILSGALILLGIVVELILFLLDRRKR